MKVIYPTPSDQTLSEFITNTHLLERIHVLPYDIEKTRIKKGYNPFVAGHLTAMKYGIDYLVNNAQWPADHPIQWENETKSDTTLFWLKSLHTKIMTPVTQSPPDPEDTQPLTTPDCGKYRLRTKTQGLGRPMPKPSSLTRLMHLWNCELCEYHLKIANSLRKPTLPQVLEFSKAAQTFHNKLLCISPFWKGNGVTARLFENLLRSRWGLPWRIHKGPTYIQSIIELEDSPSWQKCLDDLNAREPNSKRRTA